MDSMSNQDKIAILRDRAFMLAQSRLFFAQRGVIEVDCPILSNAASVDAHIDLITTTNNEFLHSSPEYGMKRLLSDGIGDIYQLSHVFRAGEKGKKHNPEFMMAEWYRIGFTFDQLIEETLDFVRLFLGIPMSSRITYRQAFEKYVGLDYVKSNDHELRTVLKDLGVEHHGEEQDKEELLNQILAIAIEPHLGKEELCILSHYPASQAALAKTCLLNNELVAERFEIYYKGLELANGYHELADPHEQRLRLLEANQQRKTLGKQELPIDELFLAALEKGLPDSCGVAVGFDRLMMLRHNKSNIADVTVSS